MADTDAAGVVYHANYLRFAEQARTEMANELGFPNHVLMQEHNCLFIIRHAKLDYHKPARCGDELIINTVPKSIDGVKLLVKQQIWSNNKHLTDLDILLICVNLELRPLRVPKFIKNRLRL